MLVVWVGFALACETPIQLASDRREYSRALETMARDQDAGIVALRSFISRYPRSSVADDAALRLADALIEQGSSGEALEQLVWAIRNHPKADRNVSLTEIY